MCFVTINKKGTKKLAVKTENNFFLEGGGNFII